MSRLSDILDTVQAQLGAIQVANGYNTDAGLNMAIFRTFRDADNEPWTAALTLTFQIQTLSAAGGDNREQLRLTIIGQAKINGGDEFTVFDQLLQDIQQAIDLKNLSPHAEDGRPNSVQPGLGRLGSNIIEAHVVYLIPYWDQYGNPLNS